MYVYLFLNWRKFRLNDKLYLKHSIHHNISVVDIIVKVNEIFKV